MCECLDNANIYTNLNLCEISDSDSAKYTTETVHIIALIVTQHTHQTF